MRNTAYEVCAPSVIGEVIDGEAIIMDLRSGAYYSTDGLGGVIWSLIEAGVSHDELIAWTTAAFPDAAGAPADVAAFIEDLLARDLIRTAPEGSAAAAEARRPEGAYAAPVLTVHEDMQDLILLDPIHDVNEKGWPTRKADA